MRNALATLLVAALTIGAATAQDDMAVTSADGAFLAELQRAIADDDRDWLADHVAYPLVVSRGEQTSKIATRKQFLARYTSIVTPAVVLAVRTQRPEALFKNYQGVMIGNGELWFDQVTSDEDLDNPSWRYAIIAVNRD